MTGDSTPGTKIIVPTTALIGAQVVYGNGKLADVVGFRGRMLKIRHFNGEDAGEVSLDAVRLLHRR